MKTTVFAPHTIKLKKNEVLFAAGDDKTDLYIVHSGQLMICVSEGTKVTPLAYLGQGEYIGELSFFDKEPRSATVICVKDAELIQIPSSEITAQFPSWLVTLARSLTKKIRYTDEVIRKAGIRKKKVETVQALDIDEQRAYYQAIQAHKGK